MARAGLHEGNGTMRLLLAAAALLALADCASNEPLCRYWTDEPIGRNIFDPSAVPMLPYNPYWVGANAPEASPWAEPGNDACAGEPGHPGPR